MADCEENLEEIKKSNARIELSNLRLEELIKKLLKAIKGSDS